MHVKLFRVVNSLVHPGWLIFPCSSSLIRLFLSDSSFPLLEILILFWARHFCAKQEGTYASTVCLGQNLWSKLSGVRAVKAINRISALRQVPVVSASVWRAEWLKTDQGPAFSQEISLLNCGPSYGVGTLNPQTVDEGISGKSSASKIFCAPLDEWIPLIRTEGRAKLSPQPTWTTTWTTTAGPSWNCSKLISFRFQKLGKLLYWMSSSCICGQYPLHHVMQDLEKQSCWRKETQLLHSVLGLAGMEPLWCCGLDLWLKQRCWCCIVAQADVAQFHCFLLFLLSTPIK